MVKRIKALFSTQWSKEYSGRSWTSQKYTERKQTIWDLWLSPKFPGAGQHIFSCSLPNSSPWAWLWLFVRGIFIPPLADPERGTSLVPSHRVLTDSCGKLRLQSLDMPDHGRKWFILNATGVSAFSFSFQEPNEDHPVTILTSPLWL